MNFSAVLLTGGDSSRMGQDKATLLVAGEPLWQIQLNKLRQLQPKKISVAARTDPSWRPADVQFVADKLPSHGPISGITAALSRLTTDHLLVLAIDMPFMTEAYFRKLVGQTDDGVGVVPVMENRAEPLAAIYPRQAAAEFSAALAGNAFSLQPLTRTLISLGKLRPLQVLEREHPLFRNLNEPLDLKSDR